MSPWRSPLLLAAALVSALTVAAGCDTSNFDPTGTGSGGGAATSVSGVDRITPAEGHAMLQQQGGAITLIDVRTSDEFIAEHIAGAVNLDIEGGQFSKLIADMPKDAVYIVYCHSGRRSAIAADAMAQAGFGRIYDLGGIADWESAGFPVVNG